MVFTLTTEKSKEQKKEALASFFLFFFGGFWGGLGDPRQAADHEDCRLVVSLVPVAHVEAVGTLANLQITPWHVGSLLAALHHHDLVVALCLLARCGCLKESIQLLRLANTIAPRLRLCKGGELLPL